MNLQEFTLILDRDPDMDEADRLHGVFNDGTISTLCGVPQVHFHREAPSLEIAIRSAIRDVAGCGFSVARVEMAPDALQLVG